MKSFISTALLAGICALPSTATSAAMQASALGAGPHGYDWLVGIWNCKNSMPSASEGPVNQTLTVTKANTGALMLHVAGAGFDGTGYLAFLPRTKTWTGAFAFGDGTYSSESSTQSGEKVVFSGWSYNPSGKATPSRDTFDQFTTKYTDKFEMKIGGTWKAMGTSTCSKQ